MLSQLGVNQLTSRPNRPGTGGGGGSSPGQPTGVTWTSTAADTTPDFSMTLTGAIAGDHLFGEYCADGNGFVSVTTYFDRVLTAGEVIAQAATVNEVVPLSDGAYDFRFKTISSGVSSAWSAKVDVTVNQAPTATFNPLDNDIGVNITTSPTITFNKSVMFNAGTLAGAILLKKLDGTLIESFDLPGDIGTGNGQISISGAVLTINPTASLVAGNDYYILVDATAVYNLNGIAYAGIASTTAWSFSSTGVWTTVWTASFTVFNNFNDSGDGTYTFVLHIPNAAFSATGGTQVRLTLKGPTGASAESTELSAIYIGHVGGSNAYSFNGDQVRLQYLGSNTIDVPIATTIVTDPVAFVKNGSAALAISFSFNNNSAKDNMVINGGTLVTGTSYYRNLLGDAVTQNKAGYSSMSPNDLAIISMVELLL